MFGFRRAILEFQENQLRINAQRHEINDLQLQTIKSLSRRIDLLEERVERLGQALMIK